THRSQRECHRARTQHELPARAQAAGNETIVHDGGDQRRQKCPPDKHARRLAGTRTRPKSKHAAPEERRANIDHEPRQCMPHVCFIAGRIVRAMKDVTCRVDRLRGGVASTRESSATAASEAIAAPAPLQKAVLTSVMSTLQND